MVADLFMENGLYEWDVTNGKIIVWINFEVNESSSQVRTSPPRKIQKVKIEKGVKIKKEKQLSPVLDPACFKSSPPRTSIEPPRLSIETELFFPQTPSPASQEDSPQSPINARTTSSLRAPESGPAYHTRHIH